MKIFENKSIFKKIVIVLLIVLIASFCFSGKVQADDGMGGKLLSPIADLLVFLGDGLMDITHSAIYNIKNTTITIDLANNFWNGLLTVSVGILAAVVVGAIVVFTGGVAAAVFSGVAAVSAGTVLAVSVTGGIIAGAYFNSTMLPDDLYLPVYVISPEQIFSNEVLLFDVDFFNPESDKTLRDDAGQIIKDDDGNTVITSSTAKALRKVISSWYNILRDLAIVILLSVLVYTGIRIVISSTSNDKAKYKQMIMDWIVAMCLLFVMQYIMAFSNLIIKQLTKAITTTSYKTQMYMPIFEDNEKKIEKQLKEMGYTIDQIKDDNGNVFWPTNLMGMVRLQAQMAKDSNTSYAGYAVIFLVLVLFTIYFIFTYLRRVLYMAFLTIIAPFVAMTYPIDKITDGKAQAFNMWFKEYLFNLLIQPLHLILYTVLITSAFELASTNIIYSLVALGFMIPAEKLLRKFFGFEKAQTPGFLGGAAGAAMTMTAMNKLLSKGPKGGGKSGDSKSSPKDGGNNQRPPRINSEFSKQDAMLGLDAENDEHQNDNGKDKNPDIGQEENQDNFDDYNSDNPQIDEQSNNNESEDVNYNDIDEEEYDENNIGQQDMTDSGEYDENNIGQQEIEDYQDDDIGSGTPELYEQDDFEGQLLDEMSARYDMNEEENNIEDNKDSHKGNRDKSKKIKNVSNKKGKKRNGRPSVAKYYLKGLGKKAVGKIASASPAKAIARTAGGIAVGAVAGGIGLAAGIASGDVSKTVQYAGGAALGGYKLGTGGVSGLNQALQVDGMEEIQERAKYKNEQEYKDAMQKKYVNEYKKDIKNQFKLEQKYGKKEAKEVMKNVVPECLDKGITNMDDIITINELVKSGVVDNVDMGIATAKYASMMGDVTKMKEKDRNEWHKTLKTGYEKNKRIKATNRNPEEEADKSMERIRMFYNIKSEL